MSLSLICYACSAATNATSSLFLKLPAELRQRIYNYALGGNTLHVASPVNPRKTSGPDYVTICTCPEDYEHDTHSHMRREASFLHTRPSTVLVDGSCALALIGNATSNRPDRGPCLFSFCRHFVRSIMKVSADEMAQPQTKDTMLIIYAYQRF